MKEDCLLCRNIAEVSRPDSNKGEYLVECDICKNYVYDIFFKNAYLALSDHDRAMISAYTRQLFESGEEPPLLRDPDQFIDIIEINKKMTIDNKLNNLILYIKKKSNFLGDEIPWDAKLDYPITYSPNSDESLNIRDLAKRKGLLYRKSRDAGEELSGEGWQKAESLEKGIQMSKEEDRYRFLVKLNEISNGNVNEFVKTLHLAKEIGLSRKDAFNFVRYFNQKGSIILRADTEDVISITAKGIDEAEENRAKSPLVPSVFGDEVFIVHGHDNEIKQSVARFVESLGPKVVILHEQPNAGRTIIEKFEEYANVGFAVVLLSPDDVGASKENTDLLKPRARQNVILELGVFIGKLGRKRVCVISKGDVEIPSDISGVIYVEYDNKEGWKNKLAKELNEAGIKIDSTALLKI